MGKQPRWIYTFPEAMILKQDPGKPFSEVTDGPLLVHRPGEASRPLPNQLF